MDEDLAKLEGEFCPPIDPALVSAVYSDYVGSSDAVDQARAVLEMMKESALVEQGTEFDPSASSGLADPAHAHSSPYNTASDDLPDEWRSQGTTETDHTGISNGLSSLSIGTGSRSGSEDSNHDACFKDSEGMDTPAKEALLAETFPQLRLELVAYTLKKSSNDLNKAMDELLNHVYFEDVKSSPEDDNKVVKGIDAFGEDHHIPHRGKKGKGRKKQKGSYFDVSSASTSDSDLITSTARNKWADGNRDVEFIASRISTSTAVVSSLYHRNGASTAQTIMALIDKDVAAHKEKEQPDAATIQMAIDLNEEFPNLDLEHALSLIRLTAPSTANAHQLAKAIITQPTTRGRSGIDVIPRYAPINLDDSIPEVSRLPSLPPSATIHNTASLSAARSRAFDQASAAHRKGRSTPTMRAAAGYYSQLGRDLNANLKAQSEVEADALVSSQSTPTVLDLHGVSVASATRIAKQRTRAWWDGLGEARIPGGGRRGAGDGYRIITGLGRHSEGGRGKLGPAVVRSLMAEGWKVEIGTGELCVLGLGKRR